MTAVSLQFLVLYFILALQPSNSLQNVSTCSYPNHNSHNIKFSYSCNPGYCTNIILQLQVLNLECTFIDFHLAQGSSCIIIHWSSNIVIVSPWQHSKLHHQQFSWMAMLIDSTSRHPFPFWTGFFSSSLVQVFVVVKSVIHCTIESIALNGDVCKYVFTIFFCYSYTRTYFYCRLFLQNGYCNPGSSFGEFK